MSNSLLFNEFKSVLLIKNKYLSLFVVKYVDVKVLCSVELFCLLSLIIVSKIKLCFRRVILN